MIYPSVTSEPAKEEFRSKVTRFLSSSGAALSFLERNPKEVVVLAAMKELVAQLDLTRLSDIPRNRLSRIVQILGEAERAAEYVRMSGDPLRSFNLPRPARPYDTWEDALAELHDKLLSDITPILFRQVKGLVHAMLPPNASVDTKAIPGSLDRRANLWKYMPLKNFIRTVQTAGIWMCSMRKLASWSNQGHGIPDTHEGELPIFLERLRKEYETARIAGNIVEFVAKLPLMMRGQVGEILGSRLEKDRLFVSSWIQHQCEDIQTWVHYGDGGQGVALKSSVEKLINGAWKVPAAPSVVVERTMLRRLLLRPVRYLGRNETGPKLDDIDEFYAPFLKREEFSKEQEVRLLAEFDQPSGQDGFVLGTDLHQLLDGIVIGPKASEDTSERIVQLMKEYQPRLLKVPLTHSRLRES